MFGKNSILHQDIVINARPVSTGLSGKVFGGRYMAEERKSTWPGTDYQSQIYHDPNQKAPKKE